MLKRFFRGSNAPFCAVVATRCWNSSSSAAPAAAAVEEAATPAAVLPSREGGEASVLTPIMELSLTATRQQKSAMSDPKIKRYSEVALSLIALAFEQYKEKSTVPSTLSPKRLQQLAELQKGGYSFDGSSESSTLPYHRLVNLLSAYIRYECEIESQKTARQVGARLRGVHLEEACAKYRLSPLEMQYVLHVLSDAVEGRTLPLVVGSRLLRRRWPESLLDATGSAYHRFVSKSIFAWIAEDLQKDSISATDARAILNNSAFALKNGASMLVGKLAMVAIRDIEEQQNAETLISLMWSVSSSGVHAPDAFWRRVFLRLVELNRSQSGISVGESETVDSFVGGRSSHPDEGGNLKEGEASPATQRARAKRSHQTHVFSGLTTRQIFRTLGVLKSERWSGAAGEMHELADQALKNIMFEAEALVLSEGEEKTAISKRVVVERLRSIADLSIPDFLSLLTIAGDLGVPFHISALRVSDVLFVPLVRYLDQKQLLAMLLVIRQTRCYSPPLINCMAKQIEQRGTSAPYALPLSKALLRATCREKSLFLEPTVTSFVHFFYSMARETIRKVRASELSTLADVVYSVFRNHTPNSAIGLESKRMIDIIAEQADRLLQLQLCSTQVPSKILELTIVMGMRSELETYVNTASLLQTRNAAERLSDAESLTILDSDLKGEEGASESSGKPVKPVVAQWSALAESELPQVPRAALYVYNELVYFFEKIAVVRSDVVSKDTEKFESVMDQTGLYNMFLGAFLMQQGHLAQPVDHNRSALNTLPLPIQRRIHRFILRKLSHTSPKAESSGKSETLHTLGQVHCSAEKVDKLIHMILNGPLSLTKSNRDVWIFVSKLADQFGTATQQQRVQEILRKSLY